MPSTYRPYYPRVNRQPQSQGDAERGLAVGASIGKLISPLAGAIKDMRQDAVANQLMDQQSIGDQPGAGVTQDLGTLPADGSTTADSGTSDNWQLPDSSSPVPGATDGTVGGLLHTGGVDEMKLRQEAVKNQLTTQDMQAQIAQRRAAAALAGGRARGGGGVNLGGGNASAWIRNRAGGGQPGATGSTAGQGTTRGGKPAPYVPNSSDIQNDESSDDFSKIAADFDTTYGQKGLYGKYQANISNLQPDDKGNYPLLDAKGNTIATVPGSDAPTWMARTNAARVKSGLQPLGQPAPASNPTANAPAGTLVNPYAPKDSLGIRAVPYGSYIIDPATGKTVQKNRPATQ